MKIIRGQGFSAQIRVLVVEDSRTQRELLVGLLRAEGFAVIGTASNGQEAVTKARQLRPDVIAMDISLPIQDGYEATNQIMRLCPTPVVMISSRREVEAELSVRALAVGAVAIVRKPLRLQALSSEQERLEFLTTLRLMAGVQVVTRFPPRILRPSSGASSPPASQGTPVRSTAPQIVAIAASTGGPTALQRLLSDLGERFPLPILVVQHIASGFVDTLIRWMNDTVPLPVQMVRHQERLLPGHVYLAPDSQHLVVRARGVATLRPPAPSDHFCPSADILFQSLAASYGSRAIGVVLTGMGTDGARGLLALRAAGGQTLAQDRASCVVYGMPQAAAALGAATYIEPLLTIGHTIRQLCYKRS